MELTEQEYCGWHDVPLSECWCEGKGPAGPGPLPTPAAVRDEMAKDGWQIAEGPIAAMLRAVERLREGS